MTGPVDPTPAELAACCRWPEFGPRLAALGPFASTDALEAAGRTLIDGLPTDTLRGVLASYPPLGSPPTEHPAAGGLSRAEEAGLHAAGPAVVAEVRELAERYRARFGFTYLVAARDRSGTELLADLRARLTHDPVAELAASREQLARKVELRLSDLVTPPAARTG